MKWPENLFSLSPCVVNYIIPMKYILCRVSGSSSGLKPETPKPRAWIRKLVFKDLADFLCWSFGDRWFCDFWLCYCRSDCLWFLIGWLLYCWTGLMELRKSQLVSGTCCVLWTLHETLVSLLKKKKYHL